MHNAVITIPQHSNGRLYKTSLCRHYDMGNCSIGTKCQFAHGEKELRTPNDPLPEKIPALDSNIVITNYKTVLCKYDQQGFCKNGTTCPYAHGASEKKTARIVPTLVKKSVENKENDEEMSVDKFLLNLLDKLMNNDQFSSDKTVFSLLKSTQKLIQEQQLRDAAEQLSLLLSSPQRTKQQQQVYEQAYNSLIH